MLEIEHVEIKLNRFDSLQFLLALLSVIDDQQGMRINLPLSIASLLMLNNFKWSIIYLNMPHF